MALRANRNLHSICGGPSETAAWLDKHEAAVAQTKPEALFELRHATADGWRAAVARAEQVRRCCRWLLEPPANVTNSARCRPALR